MHNISIKRALLSVSDKKNLLPFAQKLADLGVEILSTGGTAKLLTDAGIKVTVVLKPCTRKSTVVYWGVWALTKR
ncbi:MAG: hypothetical protein CR977_03890 [Gammaproteobacteria bacterium]|nr:MAG: hypothetical protein CR977_03890 [Gammaproteobacteria bacterium]